MRRLVPVLDRDEYGAGLRQLDAGAELRLGEGAAEVRSMPMTSPVDFISGPRMTSTPGKRANGNTDFLDRHMIAGRRLEVECASFSPAITRAAILAIGTPVAFATNGTVRLARGLTSRT